MLAQCRRRCSSIDITIDQPLYFFFAGLHTTETNYYLILL